MKLLRFSIFALLFSTSVVVSADERTVESATDSLVRLLVDTEAVEHRKARKIHYLKDMPGMVLVFFTLQGFTGGNNYTFYLAVFEPIWKFDPSKGEAQQPNASNISKYRLVGYTPVGGKGWRIVDFRKFTVENRLITLQTKEYASNDPLCCPSKTGTVLYKIENDKVIELKPNNSLQPMSALTRRRS